MRRSCRAIMASIASMREDMPAMASRAAEMWEAISSCASDRLRPESRSSLRSSVTTRGKKIWLYFPWISHSPPAATRPMPIGRAIGAPVKAVTARGRSASLETTYSAQPNAHLCTATDWMRAYVSESMAMRRLSSSSGTSNRKSTRSSSVRKCSTHSARGKDWRPNMSRMRLCRPRPNVTHSIGLPLGALAEPSITISSSRSTALQSTAKMVVRPRANPGIITASSTRKRPMSRIIISSTMMKNGPILRDSCM
mmetsp:Transcript_11699/g.37152  ORF Transcript_11699/g.37152 Transcript_11699/m.37152 type:complete len:253 (+) Transcript_11699:283-1041(+)